jgi:hypothetical protein
MQILTNAELATVAGGEVIYPGPGNQYFPGDNGYRMGMISAQATAIMNAQLLAAINQGQRELPPTD